MSAIQRPAWSVASFAFAAVLASCAPDPHAALEGSYELEGWNSRETFHCVQRPGTPVNVDDCQMFFPRTVTTVGDEPRVSVDHTQISSVPGDQARYFPTDMTPYVDPVNQASAVVWLRAYVPPVLELIELASQPDSARNADAPPRPRFVLRGTTPTGVVQIAFDHDRRVLPFDPGPNEPGATVDLPTQDLSNCVRTPNGPYCTCYMFWTYRGSVVVEDGTETPDGVPRAVLTVQVASHVRERHWLQVPQHVNCGALLEEYNRVSPGRYVTNETLRLTYRRAAHLREDHASVEQATVEANPFNLDVWVKARPWWSRF